MFRDIVGLRSMYSSIDDDIVNEFYNPILKNAKTFDRVSAYFSASALGTYAKGLEFFSDRGNKYRLIISKDISEKDFDEIKQGYIIKKNLQKDLLVNLREKITLNQEKGISNLAYLISIGTVEIKIAFKKVGIFHDKCGILTDDNGDEICFRGSNNETKAAIENNYEAFNVICSWFDYNGFYKDAIAKSKLEFEKLWSNEHRDIVVLDIDDVVRNEILQHNKGELIVETLLLKENALILDYNNSLVLRINTYNMNKFIYSGFFKLHLKMYVEKIIGNTIYFKSGLSYLIFQKIQNKLSKKAPSLGLSYYSTRKLLDFINAKNIYIDSRAKLGLELKQNNVKFDKQFQEFCNIISDNMSRKLREKQLRDAFFMVAMMRVGNFSVPGSGKTASVLGMYAFLKTKGLVKRIVMIGPKSSFGSWIDEFSICFRDKEKLNVFNIHDIRYTNITSKKKALEYDSGASNLFLFNYESLAGYEKELKRLINKDTLLVYDEIHKVKRIEGNYAKHALAIAENASYKVVLTGTPLPNSYLDIYNMLNILFADEFSEFFGFDIRNLRYPVPSDIKEINSKIQPFFCRTTKKELGVPAVNCDVKFAIESTYVEQRLFEIISSKYRSNKLVLFLRILQLESNPKLLLESLDPSDFENIVEITDDIEDIDIVDYSHDVIELIMQEKITSKKRECINRIEDLVKSGKKLICWCIFKDSIRNITSILRGKNIKAYCIYGEIALEDRNDIINDFKNGKIDVLITNPHTLGESISLHSVCHDAIYFEYSYNLVHLLQSKDRIHRLGLPMNQYTQYYYMQNKFIVDGNSFSLDEKVYQSLSEKEKIMINAIENNELEEVFTSKEDLEKIFGNLFNDN